MELPERYFTKLWDSDLFSCVKLPNACCFVYGADKNKPNTTGADTKSIWKYISTSTQQTFAKGSVATEMCPSHINKDRWNIISRIQEPHIFCQQK